MRTTITLKCLILSCLAQAWGFQAPTPAPASASDIHDVIARLTAARALPATAKDNADRIVGDALRDLALIGVLTGHVRSALTDVERQRLDKQPGAGSSAAGSTSLVERGTVPFLLGAAVENGAVTRATNGTSITFTARPAGMVKFLGNQDLFNSAINSDSNIWAQLANKGTASVTFDVSRGGTNNTFTGATNQVSGYSLHFDIYNQRDPREPKWANRWIRSMQSVRSAASAKSALQDAIESDPGLNAWIDDTAKNLATIPDAQLESTVRAALEQLASTVAPKRLAASAEFRAAMQNAANAANQAAGSRTDLVQSILRSPTLAVEYSVTRQMAPVTATSTTLTTTTGAPVTNLPDLGALRVIAAIGLKGDGNLTLNASMTNFNNTFRSDRIRDYQIGLQFDAPITDIKDWGKVSLSLSGLYLNLKQQPLGQTVKVNSVEINSIGNTGFLQAKLEVPFGSGGIRLPLAITYASRHELLVNEKNKFGANIGLTFDLDKLMSSQKKATQ